MERPTLEHARRPAAAPGHGWPPRQGRPTGGRNPLCQEAPDECRTEDGRPVKGIAAGGRRAPALVPLAGVLGARAPSGERRTGLTRTGAKESSRQTTPLLGIVA